MLSVSAVDSEPLLGTMNSIETNATLALAFFTMIYYAASVVIDSEYFDPWRRMDRIRRHRCRRRYRRRRRGRRSDVSSCCVTDRSSSSCLPAPLPTPLHHQQESTLRDLVRIQAWDSVIRRCATREGRREAKLRDIDGLHSLHWACSGGPTADAIRSLIKAYPKAAKKRDFEGSTPLHFACHYGIRSIEVLKVLIDACPAAVHRRDIYGRSPLWHAVEKRASVDVLGLLLQADPSTALLPLVPGSVRRYRSTTNNQEATTSSRELTYRSMRQTTSTAKKAPTSGYEQEEQAQSRSKRKFPSSSTPSTPLGLAWKQATYMNAHKRGRGKNTAGWNKAVLLLKAAYHHISLEKFKTSKTLRATSMSIDFSVNNILHAALALNAHIPSSIVSFILHKYPEQAFRRDRFAGHLPLSIALSVHFQSPSSRRDVIVKLLDINPRAASMSSADGKQPLTIALENGILWNEGIEDLIRANPKALHTIDKTRSGLYPFMIAACAPLPTVTNTTFESEDETKRVETIYKLLRGAPDLVPTKST